MSQRVDKYIRKLFLSVVMIGVLFTTYSCTNTEVAATIESPSGESVTTSEEDFSEFFGTMGDEIGIEIDNEANNNEFIGNEVEGGEIGVLLSEAYENVVMSNIIFGSSWSGIYAEEAPENVISSNTLYDNGDWGILLECSNDNEVVGNSFEENGYGGLGLLESDNNEILENDVYDSGCMGVQVMWSEDNLIQWNVVLGSGCFDLYDTSWPLENDWVDNEYETKNWPP